MGRILVVLFPLLVFALEDPQYKNCYQKLFEFNDLIEFINKEGSEEQKSALRFFETLADNQQSNLSIDGESPDDTKIIEDVGVLGLNWKEQANINFEILVNFLMLNINIDDYEELKSVLIEIKTIINPNDDSNNNNNFSCNNLQGLQNSF